MKTRIIHTQFWDDSYILKLSPKEKLLFVFYFTNSKCGQTPYYEISSEVTKLVTGLSLKEINDYKTRFQADRKYIFVDDWVYIVNAEKYQNYKGEKNEKAYDNEYLLIPQQIKEKVNTLLKEIDSVSIVYPYPMDTTINHKSEIINHKSEIKNTELAEKVLKWFNKAMDTNFKSYYGFKDNLDFWSKVYSEEDIKKALLVLRSGAWWAKDPTPTLLFRRKSPKGEPVDYIGELLNLKGGENT